MTNELDTPHSDAIRDQMVARAEAFAERSKMSLSAISKMAVKDDRFLARAKAGHNFTLRTYQQLIDWLDAQDSAPDAGTSDEVAA